MYHSPISRKLHLMPNRCLWRNQARQEGAQACRC
jgi:hypothetical protein